MEIQRQKAVAKFLAQQKLNEQLVEEVRASPEAVNAAAEKAEGGGVVITKEDRGPNVTTRPRIDNMPKGADPSTMSAHLKWLHATKQTGPWKKTKASKLDGEPITVTEGDLCNIGDTVHKVTKEVLQEAMTEQQIVLGALTMKLQELQVQPPQHGMVATYMAMGTSTTEQFLRAKMANIIMLSEGELIVDSMEDKSVVGQLKGLCLNLDTPPQEILYQQQDGATTELRAREGCVVQLLSEQ